MLINQNKSLACGSRRGRTKLDQKELAIDLSDEDGVREVGFGEAEVGGMIGKRSGGRGMRRGAEEGVESGDAGTREVS